MRIRRIVTLLCVLSLCVGLFATATSPSPVSANGNNTGYISPLEPLSLPICQGLYRLNPENPKIVLHGESVKLEWTGEPLATFSTEVVIYNLDVIGWQTYLFSILDQNLNFLIDWGWLYRLNTYATQPGFIEGTGFSNVVVAGESDPGGTYNWLVVVYGEDGLPLCRSDIYWLGVITREGDGGGDDDDDGGGVDGTIINGVRFPDSCNFTLDGPGGGSPSPGGTSASTSVQSDNFIEPVPCNNLIFGNDNANNIQTLTGEDLIFGFDGNDTLDGGDGNDTIDGGLGDDSILGGAGADSLLSGLGGSDTMEGGDGDDTIQNDSPDAGGIVDGGADNDLITNNGGLTSIDGGDGADTIVNSLAGNIDNATGDGIFDDSGGNSIINDGLVNGGANAIVGSGGNDTLVNSGSGTLTSTGDDGIEGGGGNNSLVNDGLIDVFSDGMIGAGGSGSDTYINNGDIQAGDNGIETGTVGNDSVYNSGSGTIQATNAGVDFFNGGSGTLINEGLIEGGVGVDGTGAAGVQIVDNQGGGTITGTGGAALDLGGGNDSVNNDGRLNGDVLLGDGNDTFAQGSTGVVNDTTSDIDGGADTDLIDLTDISLPVTLDLGTGANSNVNVTGNIINFENANTGSGADTITDSAADNVINSGDGDDLIIKGNDGDDTLNGEGGGDVFQFLAGVMGTVEVDGGSGTNTLDFSLFGAPITIIWSGDFTGTATDTGLTVNFSNIQTVILTEFADTADATATTLGVTIEGLGGDDTLTGGSGNDTLIGGDGLDDLFGGLGNDSIDGGADNDFILGGAGNDTLEGGTEDDVIFGGSANGSGTLDDGDDSITDADGGNYLVGGNGNAGGVGNDGNDTIIVNGSGISFIVGGNENATANCDGTNCNDGSDLIIDLSSGNDQLAGGNANFVSGSVGNDLGADTLITGSDTALLDTGSNTLHGGNFNQGGAGNDSGAGDLIQDLNDDNDFLFGGNYNDSGDCTGGNCDDTGNDTLIDNSPSSGGGDSLFGGNHNLDNVSTSVGNDNGDDSLAIIAGGNDGAAYGGNHNDGGVGNDAGSDTLTVSNTRDDQLFGGNLNDTGNCTGGNCDDGSDSLVDSGSGADSLFGGNQNDNGTGDDTGADTLVISGAGNTVFSSVFGGNLNNGGVGNDGGDSLVNQGTGTVLFDPGPPVVPPSGANLFGGNANNTTNCDGVTGNCNDGADTLLDDSPGVGVDGNIGGNLNLDGVGHDTGAGDIITLTGNSSNPDTVYGGNANVTSGTGNDTDGEDTITDQSDGSDDIIFGGNFNNGNGSCAAGTCADGDDSISAVDNGGADTVFGGNDNTGSTGDDGDDAITTNDGDILDTVVGDNDGGAGGTGTDTIDFDDPGDSTTDGNDP